MLLSWYSLLLNYFRQANIIVQVENLRNVLFPRGLRLYDYSCMVKLFEYPNLNNEITNMSTNKSLI